jgi:hypothetical protein
MQTSPSCSIEPYAVIEFNNYTKVDKFTYIQRYYDNEPLGEPIVKIVEAKTTHRYRVPPGYYELGVKKIDGTYQAWQTKAQRNVWSMLGACDTVVVNMAEKKLPAIEKKINPRRSIS